MDTKGTNLPAGIHEIKATNRFLETHETAPAPYPTQLIEMPASRLLSRLRSTTDSMTGIINRAYTRTPLAEAQLPMAELNLAQRSHAHR